MQKQLLIMLALLSLTWISCSPKMFQVMDVKSIDLKDTSNVYYYENSEVRIEYYFWSKNGSVAFSIFNKTSKPIYIDWFKSHLVYNGYSYDYWTNSEETTVFYSSTTSTNQFSSAYTTTGQSGTGNSAIKSTISTIQKSGKNTTINTTHYKPIRLIQVPASSYVYANKFSVNSKLFYNCDFHLKPRKTRNPVSLSFDEDKSPLNFRNIVTYSTAESFGTEVVVDNAFYIGAIHIMSDKLFKGKRKSKERCNSWGETIKYSEFPYPYMNAGSFYLE